ncbi:hypothetical protein GUJ93_ZPchr0010g10380 [Zizania palustris]|uniref:Uncharacterized protein n=1 Tax=Zizania palustris TaxID=103762 RepID=A0A8J5WHD5_ZIZPA|nr:hypothetical protein GUJ93_ZPchr0010g10380 [Zizania palustris]
MLLDLDAMSMEELIGQLRVAEDADKDDTKAKEVATEVVRQLMLTETQWEARRREQNRERKPRGGDKRRGNGGDGDDDRSDANDETNSLASGTS